MFKSFTVDSLASQLQPEPQILIKFLKSFKKRKRDFRKLK